MGLDISHDCWHGAYSAFGRWREKLCEVAGYGDIHKREGFGGDVPWPSPKEDALIILLDHCDCEGELKWKDCAAIADRLESLLPAMTNAGDGGGHIGLYADATEQFVKGLRLAAKRKENVDFD